VKFAAIRASQQHRLCFKLKDPKFRRRTGSLAFSLGYSCFFDRSRLRTNEGTNWGLPLFPLRCRSASISCAIVTAVTRDPPCCRRSTASFSMASTVVRYYATAATTRLATHSRFVSPAASEAIRSFPVDRKQQIRSNNWQHVQFHKGVPRITTSWWLPACRVEMRTRQMHSGPARAGIPISLLLCADRHVEHSACICRLHHLSQLPSGCVSRRLPKCTACRADSLAGQSIKNRIFIPVKSGNGGVQLSAPPCVLNALCASQPAPCTPKVPSPCACQHQH